MDNIIRQLKIENRIKLVKIDAEGYALSTQTVLLENLTQNLTFSLYDANSFNLTIYDEKTETLINDSNITINFIGDSGNNYTYYTGLGHLYVDDLAIDTYVIRYSNRSYGDLPRHYSNQYGYPSH